MKAVKNFIRTVIKIAINFIICFLLYTVWGIPLMATRIILILICAMDLIEFLF